MTDPVTKVETAAVTEATAVKTTVDTKLDNAFVRFGKYLGRHPKTVAAVIAGVVLAVFIYASV